MKAKAMGKKNKTVEPDTEQARSLASEKTKGKTEFRSLTLSRETVDEDTRVVRMAMSSEEPVDRWFGREILDHSETSIDLDFMRSQSAPLLLDHDSRQQIGVIESVELDSSGRKLRADVRFGKNQQADEIFTDVVDGIRSNVSIGYRISEMVLEKRDDDDGDTYRAVRWQPLEVSIVSIPADRTVGIGRSASNLGAEPNINQNTRTKTMDKNIEEPTVSLEGYGGAAQISDEMRASFEQDTNARIAAARKEVSSISDLGAKHNQGEMAREAIAKGESLATFQGRLLDVIGDKPLTDSDIGMSKDETRSYSVMKLVNALANPANRAAQNAAAFELEASAAAQDVRGSDSSGVTIPTDVLNTWAAGQRDLNTSDDSNIVFDDSRQGSFIDVLRNNSSVMQAGATFLQGLQGDVKIPKKLTGSAGGWIATEGGAASESEPTFGQVSLAPKTVGAYTDVTRQMMQQSSLAMENLIRSDLNAALSLAIDLGGLEGSGSSGQPTGVKNTSGINAPTSFAGVNPTFAEVVAMETAVAEDNALAGNTAYILNANMRGALKTTVKDAGSGQFVYDGNTMNGHRAIMSNQVTAGDLYFGDWSQLLIGMWGGLDILVDPYTASTTGTVRIVALQTVDVAVRQAVAFALNNDGA